jgi:hypothetical protein
MTHFRTHPSGCLIAPNRGNPPPAPEGYEPTDNPFVFAIKIDDCEHRTTKTMKKGCCGNVQVLYCLKYDEITSRSDCKGCVQNGRNI